jgi:hypothetical protein
MPIDAQAASQLLTDAGFQTTAELVGALQQACEHRTASRASAIVNRLTEQPADRDVLLRLNEQIDREVVRWRR